MLAAAALPLSAQANPITILFVGNSFTHGKYDPVRTYNAQPAEVARMLDAARVRLASDQAWASAEWVRLRDAAARLD